MAGREIQEMRRVIYLVIEKKLPCAESQCQPLGGVFGFTEVSVGMAEVS